MRILRCSAISGFVAFGLVQLCPEAASETPVRETTASEQDETRFAQDNVANNLRMQVISVLGDRDADSPGSFAALGSPDIRDIAADHPAEILNTLPGVNVQMNSGQEHLIAIRSPVLSGGAGQGSFLVLENGVPIRSPAFGNVNMLFETHHEVADVIEVVRGPGSAKYGSNAVHGLMNFIFPDGGDKGAELRLSGSTLSRFKGDMITTKPDGFAALSVQHDAGWRDETSVDQVKATASHKFSLGEWQGNARASFMNLNQETAGFIDGAEAYKDEAVSKTNPNPEAFRDARFAIAAVRLERNIGEIDVSVTPYARWQDMVFRQHFLPYKGLEENSHRAIGAMGNVQGVYGPGVWRLGGMVDLASGDLKETQEDPFGFFPGDTRFPQGSHYDYTVDTLAAALWGEYEIEIATDVKMLAGLRAETHEYDYKTHIPAGISGRFNVPDDRRDNFGLVTPKLGVIWDDAAGELDLYANYARGQRAPQASDLYRLQNLQTVGEVKSETLDSLEIGVRGAALDGHLVFDLAAYVMSKKNFFFRDSAGLNVTGGKTDHIGVEAAWDYKFADRFSLNGNIGWSDQTYAFDRAANGIVDGNQIDTAPEWLGDLALEYQGDRYRAALSAEYVGKYFTDEAASQIYDGHTIASLRASYEFSDALEGFIIVRNLFDTRYADRADFAFGVDRYFPGEPLNATFGIRSRW